MDRPRLRKLIYAILVTDSEFMSFALIILHPYTSNFHLGWIGSKDHFLLDSISRNKFIYDSLIRCLSNGSSTT